MNKMDTKFSRRGFMASAGLAALGTTAAGMSLRAGAWAQSTDDLVAAAQKEGKVVLYTGSAEPLVIALADAFREEYGIQMEYQRLNSSKIASRYTAEAEAGQAIADVMIVGDQLLVDAFHQRGWLADLDPASVPGLADWPAEFKNPHSAVVTLNPHTMATNTALVPDLPKKWEDMLRPEFTGQIITVDLRSVGIVAFGAYDLLLREKGEDFLRQLGAMKVQLGSSGPAAVQQVAAGAAKLFFPCSTSQAFSMIQQGAPIEAVLPEAESYTGVVSPAAISAKAPNPNAARLFLSFLMTEKGQQILNAETVSPINAPGTPELKPGFIMPDLESSEANKQKIIELMGLA
ncbi:ABC transporter substrate-binding protein [Paracoccus thiocyanatus]|uniref:Iron(III) transport system substrate-binding protein n=1 Tax=Paracoccus thiocyanatus TaxID=34006 RepID=A0A3D8PA22_9RHOB|nr:extracellular solute-binding protein [Paracoccus thiocyanatus]RDW12926.1 hypothetical protein DIE28_11025 [Paracoccus thiocyanatus]